MCMLTNSLRASNYAIDAKGRYLGIYQAEVRHLSHVLIWLIMRLFEVLIPKMAFKFGANNFNFIRVRLGQVRLGWVMLC